MLNPRFNSDQDDFAASDSGVIRLGYEEEDNQSEDLKSNPALSSEQEELTNFTAEESISKDLNETENEVEALLSLSLIHISEPTRPY